MPVVIYAAVGFSVALCGRFGVVGVFLYGLHVSGAVWGLCGVLWRVLCAALWGVLRAFHAWGVFLYPVPLFVALWAAVEL